MKFYAVKKGKNPGIYTTWPDCQNQVIGFSGAIYKSFKTMKEAQNWLSDESPLDKDKGVKHFQLKSSQKYEIVFYTDGGSRNHGNKLGQHVKSDDKAAWAYLIMTEQEKISDTNGEYGQTNSRMEILAFVKALKKLVELNWNEKKMLAILDSKYVLDSITKGWLLGWKNNGWKKSDGSNVAHEDLWKEVYQLLSVFPNLKFMWTKGHENNEGNIFVDKLLNKTMDMM